MNPPGLVRTIVLMVLSVCAICTATGQQTKQRLITRLPTEQNEPILITSIRVNDRSVAFGEKFEAADDWLRHLSLSVKNQSDRVILFASIQLQSPVPSPSGETISIYDLAYGNWSLRVRTPTPEEQLVGLTAGATTDIRLTDEQFAEIKTFLNETSRHSSIDKIQIRINRVIFQDDTMWTRGAYTRRDPSNPGLWKNIDQ